MFRILGWAGPAHLSVRRLHESEEYPTLRECRAAAAAFRDGEPPAFRGRDEPRRFYAVSTEDGRRALRELCVA